MNEIIRGMESKLLLLFNCCITISTHRLDEKQSLDGGLKFASGVAGQGTGLVESGVNNASQVVHHGLQSALHFAEKVVDEGTKLAEHGLDVLEEIETKAPHYAGTIRKVIPFVGSTTVGDLRKELESFKANVVPSLNDIVGKSHVVVDKVSQFFQKIVNVVNDVIQIVISVANMAVTGDIGDIGKYEDDLMLRTTGTTDPGGTGVSEIGSALGKAERFMAGKLWGSGQSAPDHEQHFGSNAVGDTGTAKGVVGNAAIDGESGDGLKHMPPTDGNADLSNSTFDGTKLDPANNETPEDTGESNYQKRETAAPSQGSRDTGDKQHASSWNIFGRLLNAVKSIKNAVVGGPSDEKPADAGRNVESVGESSDFFSGARGLDIGDDELSDSDNPNETPAETGNLVSSAVTTDREMTGNDALVSSGAGITAESTTTPGASLELAVTDYNTEPGETTTDHDGKVDETPTTPDKSQTSELPTVVKIDSSESATGELDPSGARSNVEYVNSEATHDLKSGTPNVTDTETSMNITPDTSHDTTTEGVHKNGSEPSSRMNFFGKLVNFVGNVANRAAEAVVGSGTPGNAPLEEKPPENVTSETVATTVSGTVLTLPSVHDSLSDAVGSEEVRDTIHLPSAHFEGARTLNLDSESAETDASYTSSSTGRIVHVANQDTARPIEALIRPGNRTEVEEQLARPVIVDQVTPEFESPQGGAVSGAHVLVGQDHIGSSSNDTDTTNVPGSSNHADTPVELPGNLGYVSTSENLAEPSQQSNENPIIETFPYDTEIFSSVPGELVDVPPSNTKPEMTRTHASTSEENVKYGLGDSRVLDLPKIITGAHSLGTEVVHSDNPIDSLNVPEPDSAVVKENPRNLIVEERETGMGHVPVLGDVVHATLAPANMNAAPPETTVKLAPPYEEPNDVTSEISGVRRVQDASSVAETKPSETIGPEPIGGVDFFGEMMNFVGNVANKAAKAVVGTVAPEGARFVKNLARNVTKVVVNQAPPDNRELVETLAGNITEAVVNGIARVAPVEVVPLLNDDDPPGGRGLDLIDPELKEPTSTTTNAKSSVDVDQGRTLPLIPSSLTVQKQPQIPTKDPKEEPKPVTLPTDGGWIFVNVINPNPPEIYSYAPEVSS